MAYLTSDEHIGRCLDLYGEWAEAEIMLLCALVKPGDTALDVGANIGTHTLPLAKKVGAKGSVLAFEPQRFLHQLLGANLALNGISWSQAFHAAVGAQPGFIVVPNIDYCAQGSFGGLSLGAWEQGESVKLLTIDSLSLPAVALIKIDVEGMEAAVLAGAKETLSRCHPFLYVENQRNGGSPQVVEFLEAAGYALYWHFSSFFREDNFAGSTDNVFGAMVDANILAVPRSLALSISSLLPVLGPDDTAPAAALRRL